MKTWHYSLPNDRPGEGWAKITISENGMFSAVSDWGNYAFLWTHTGYKDVREFFLSAERDWQYFANKLRPEKILNEEASFKQVREEILRQRRTKDLTTKQARDAWDALSYYDTWTAYLESSECTQAFDEAWSYSVYNLHPDVVGFCKRVLPRLAERLAAELSGDRPQLGHAQDVVLARRKGFFITDERRKEVLVQLKKLSKRGLLDDAWTHASCDFREQKLYPYKFPWDGARQDVEVLLEVLKSFEGTAELVILWSTGERTGYRLDNHRVTEHSVDFLLV
jgi:hypothetical protein